MHKVDTNDLNFIKERGFSPVGFVPCEPVKGRIHPHVSMFALDNNEFVSVFHTKPVYYETRSGHWRPLSEVTKYHGNRKIEFTHAWWNVHPRYMRWLEKRQSLLGGQLLIPSPEWVKQVSYSFEQPVGMTVSTFYSDADPETTTCDGYCYTQNYSTWDGAHDATSGSAPVDAGTTMRPQSGYDNQVEARIYRTVSMFDTSTISTDTISSAVYSVYVVGVENSDNDGDDWITIVEATTAANTSLAAADYDDIGDAVDNPTEGIDTGNRVDLSGVSTSAYTDFTLNSTGIGWIDKAGITKLGMREGHDVIDVTVTASANVDNFLNVSTADETGTGQDPKFVVTHAAGGAARRVFMIS